MTTLIVIWLVYGVFSFWPLAMVECDVTKGRWYEWLCAWAVWSVCWPYRYLQDLIYWWRAKK